MRKVASEADGMLNVLRNTEAELAALGTQEPNGWAQMTYDMKVKYLDDMKGALGGTEAITKKLQDTNDQKQKMLNDLQTMGVDQGNQPQVDQQGMGMATAKRKAFNLRKFAQMPTMPTEAPAAPPAVTPQGDPQNPGSTNASQVRQMLDGVVQECLSEGGDEAQAKSQAANKAYDQITAMLVNPNSSTTDPLSNAHGNSDQTVRDAVNTYYSSNDEAEKDQAASVLARTIFPQDSTQNDSVDDGEVPAVQQEGVKVNVANFVKQTNAFIKKLAESHSIKAKSPTFNLKIAQHKALNNVIMYDQDQVTTDQFTKQPISEWHLVERNKGFGLRLTDYWGADWEKVWRDTVMDKYDPMYIERRFEVDKNIPPTNNYQLQPGEKRRITPPEYGNTEARLEAERTKMNKDRGYYPSEPGEPFNWKKAQTQKKAQFSPPSPQDNGMGNPLKPGKMKKQEWLCHACGNALEVSDNNMPMDRCNACNALQQGKALPGKFKTGPDPAKTTAPAGAASGPILASGTTDVEKLASVHGGIFFDSTDLTFVVVAGKKKKKFDTYYEAEEFKMLVQDPSAAPSTEKAPVKQKTRLTPEQIAHQRQVGHHADALGIDG